MKPVATSIYVLAVVFLYAADAHAWDECLAVCNAPRRQVMPDVAPDGAGGVIIAWADWRNSPTTEIDVYAQRLAWNGTPLWTSNGAIVCDSPGRQEHVRVIADGSGGAYVAWTDFGTGLRMQHLDGLGNRLWAVAGVELVPWMVSYYELTPDGAGGALVSWSDYRNGTDFDCFAQRLNAAGTELWEPDGVKIGAGINEHVAQALVSDGANGAIVSWSVAAPELDLFVQRISAAGARQWGGDFGVPLCTAPGSQGSCVMIPAGGGAIAAWADDRGADTDIYAQRVKVDGTMLWASNGVPVTTASGDQYNLAVSTDLAGGAIIVWEDWRLGTWHHHTNIYGQRIDGGGAPHWAHDGALLINAPGGQINPVIVPDGAAGAILAWDDTRSGTSRAIYAQRVDHSGASDWTPNGVRLCEMTTDQEYPALANVGIGKAVVAWERTWIDDSDIHATALSDSLVDSLAVDSTLTAVRVVRPSALSIVRQYPNPFSSDFRLDFTLNTPARVVIDMFDAAGRRVSTSTLGHLERGGHGVTVRGLDSSSRPLASGVYLCRVRAGNAIATRKVVIVR